MSAFKDLERSDVYLTDYIAKKQWEISGSRLGELGIGIASAYSGSLPYYYDPEDEATYSPVSESKKGNFLEGTYNMRLMYESIKALYYTASLQDGTFEGPSEYYPQTTITISGSRVLPTEVFDPRYPKAAMAVVVTLPRDIIGMGMEMGSLEAEVDSDIVGYVEEDYCFSSRKDAVDCCTDCCLAPPKHPEDPYFEDLEVGLMTDFEGVLTAEDSFVGTWSLKDGWDYPSPDYGDGVVVGDIIYSHGQIIITNVFLSYIMQFWGAERLKWKSNQPIFTEHVHCKVEDREFNRSYNPTMPKEESGITPYISAIGLYNTAGELLAIAKLSKPIKKAPNIDMTLEVRIDLG